MSVAQLPPPLRLRNKVTQARHRRETWLQIYLPFGLAALVFLAAAVLVGLGSFGGVLNNSVMADTSAVWLSLPVIFVALIILALVAGLAYGVWWLVGFLPPYFKQGQDISRSILEYTRRYADMLVKPIIAVNSRAASAQRFLAGVQESFRRDA